MTEVILVYDLPELAKSQTPPALLSRTTTKLAVDDIDEKGTEVEPAEETFPDGGLQGWLTVLGAVIVQYCTFGSLISYGVFQGWIGSIQLFLTFSCGIFTGRAFDRGYFYHLMIGGSIIHIASYFLLSITERGKFYQVFLSHGLGGGLSIGITYVPSLAIPSHYFLRKRPLAMGLVAAGSALGAVIQPIALNRLIHGHIGFHNGVRVNASLNSVLLLFACLIMRTRLPPKIQGPKLPLKELFTDSAYVFAILGGAFIATPLFFPPFFIQLYAAWYHVESGFAFYLISIYHAASVVGRIVVPLFSPQCGTANLIVFSSFSMAIVISLLLLVRDVAGFACFSVFCGFFSGGTVGLTPPVLTLLAKDVSEYGARIGINYTVVGIMGLFSSPILGALLSAEFQWWRPVVYSCVMMYASAFSLAVMRMIQTKRKGMQIV